MPFATPCISLRTEKNMFFVVPHRHYYGKKEGERDRESARERESERGRESEDERCAQMSSMPFVRESCHI